MYHKISYFEMEIKDFTVDALKEADFSQEKPTAAKWTSWKKLTQRFSVR